MVLVPLSPPDGLYKQGTVYEAKNRWYDAQLVRFLEDTVRPIGGWTRLSESQQSSYYALDQFTADPGSISADFTTDGYISDLEFAGWNVDDPTSAFLEPDPSTHLAFPLDPGAGNYGFRSVDAIEFSDFTAFIDVKWDDDPEGTTGVGMLVRANDTYHDVAGGEALLFSLDIRTGSGDPVELFEDLADGATQPDDGLLNGGFFARSGGKYTLTWAGSGTSRQEYDTEFISEDFHYYVDCERSATGNGSNSILYLSALSPDWMCLYFQTVDANNVSIRSQRQYFSGFTDAMIIETVALAYSTSIRLGVRVTGGVINAYRADPVTGDNEVSLGVITNTSDWIGDGTHTYFGCGNIFAGNAQGQSWDNLTLIALAPDETLLDSFDTTGTTDVNLWTSAETGQIYEANSGSWQVSDANISGGVLEQHAGTIQFRYCASVTKPSAISVGEEVYVDMYRATGHTGGSSYMYLNMLMDVKTPAASVNYYSFGISHSSGQVSIRCFRRYSGGSQTATGGLWDWAEGTTQRFGVTVNSVDEFQCWTEPYGGGTRTNRYLWQPTPDPPNYDYLDNLLYGYIGVGTQASQFVTGQRPYFKNLTKSGVAIARGYFQIHAQRIKNGVAYDLSGNEGKTVAVEFPWDTGQYDYTDGFRMGVDIEGSEARAWYAGFEELADPPKTYLDWQGFTAGDPLDLTYENPGGETDDYDDVSHQYAGLYREAGDITAVAATEIHRYAYQKPGFTGPIILDGIPRGAHGWERAARGYLAFGTTEKLYIYTIGFLYDVTPSGFATGAEDSTTGVEATGRYGRGAYGQLTYGVGQQGITEQFDADIWHLDTFGDLLLGCMNPADEIMYVYDPLTGDSPALAITVANGFTEDAPSPSRGLVVTPERFTVCLGKDGDSRLVAWSDRETIDIWTPTVTNQAGDFLLEGSGRIMRGMRGRGETVIWTDTDCWVMTYVSGEFVFSFEKRGTNCGLISPLGVAGIDTGFVWWSQRGFYVYDGYAKPLECPVQDFVFSDLDQLQRVKINSVVNQLFGEVWWFYPSTEQDPGECDKYVIWNYRENTWTVGELQRTCGVEASASTKNLLMLSPNGYAYNHEQGWEHTDIDGVTALVPFIESGPLEFGDGEKVFMATQFIPDEKNLGDVEGYFYTSFYPMEAEVQHGPYTMAVEQDVRLTARQMRIRLEEVVPDDWRVGVFRFEAEPGGRR